MSVEIIFHKDQFTFSEMSKRSDISLEISPLVPMNSDGCHIFAIMDKHVASDILSGLAVDVNPNITADNEVYIDG